MAQVSVAPLPQSGGGPATVVVNGVAITPAAGVDGDVARAVARGDSNRFHVAVQLQNLPDSRERAALAESGLRLLQYLGGNAYTAVLSSGGPVGQAVVEARTPAGVRSLFSLRAEAKLSERLRAATPPVWARTANGELDVAVVFHADVTPQEAETALAGTGGRVLDRAEHFNRLTARIPLAELRKLAGEDTVAFIDSIPAPFQTRDNIYSATMLNSSSLLAAPYSLSGDGVRVGIWDGGLVDAHPDLAGRLTIVDTRSYSSLHATHVAGTVAASGETDGRVKGIAPKSRIYSYTYNGDVPSKMLSAARDYGVEISQNSWGEVVSEQLDNCSDYGGYGLMEHDLDRLVREEKLSIVFAMGNDRTYTGCIVPARNGLYTTGRPASAKNVISVGALTGGYDMSAFSSFGPARDGRVKPDVVALGVGVRSLALNGGTAVLSGTSMSTPAVSGFLALLSERFRLMRPDVKPTPALLKAILLNTTKDIGNPGPDYSFGYGLPNGQAAVSAIDNGWYREGSAGEGEITHTIEVPSGSDALRVMLVWSDPEAAPDAYPVLVNNLDLQVIGPDGTTVLPLTLDPSNPSADAKPGVNQRDPVEQAVILNPAAGTYTVKILPTAVASGPQAYALAWSFAKSDKPPCTTSLVSPTLSLTEKAGTAIIDVFRANQCSEWSMTSEADWMTLAERPTTTGSGVVKMRYTANDTGAKRTGTLRLDGQTISVTQVPACRTAPIHPGDLVNEQLTRSDCLFEGISYARMYTFEGKVGDGVVIDLTSPDFDTLLGLLGPDGSIVAANDDYSAANTDSRIPAGGVFALPANGTYTIVATAYDSGAYGSFTLKLTAAPPVSIVGAVPAATAIAGCPAAIDGTLRAESNRIAHRGEVYYTDVYTVPGRIGQTLNVSITEASFDTYLYLIGPFGNVVASNDDAGGKALSSLSQTLLEAGEYRIEVTSFAPLTGGTYKLAVDGCAAP